MYWSKAKMEAHAEKYSKGYAAHKGYTFWEKDFDSMAYKTMLRQLISKWGVMSIDMISAIDADEAVIQPDGTRDYVEIGDEPTTVEADAAEPQGEAPKAEQVTKEGQEALFG